MLKILQGDWVEQLRALPEGSVHCCVTSPPYWGLRDYGVDGQLGLEKTPDEYIAKLVAGFSEVKRVLRDDGTLWLNLGDSYAAQRGGTDMPAETLAGGISGQGNEIAKRGRGTGYRAHRNAALLGLKHKDLVGVPWSVAFALRADGWYLRSDIIWSKPNPMPESVTDRPTKAHEYIFLLSKSRDYYYDADAIAEPIKSDHFRGPAEHPDKVSTNGNSGLGKWASQTKQSAQRRIIENVAKARAAGADHDNPFGTTRNKRTVWTVPTAPYGEAHFATFPPDLIKPCILAGCQVGGIVLDPFGGSGTTGQVALELGRSAILIELNPEYIKLIKDRTNTTPGLPLA